MSLERQLKKLQKSTKPEREFERALWLKLSSEFDSEYPALRFTWLRFAAFPLAAFAVFVTMGVGTYAYASPYVTEGHLLHSMKLGMERVESQLPRGPIASAEFHARMMERRIAEGEVLARQERVPAFTLDGIANEMDLTVTNLASEELDAEHRRPVIDHLQMQTVRYNYLLQGYEEVPLEAVMELRLMIQDSALATNEKQLLLIELHPVVINELSPTEEDGELIPIQFEEDISLELAPQGI